MSEESELPSGPAGSGLSRPHRSEHIETLAHLDTSSLGHQPVTKVRLLALIPNSPSGFHQVFQRSMSKQDAKILAQLRSRRVDVDSETWVDSDLFGKRQLFAKMKSYDDSETVVIMAHSTKDGKSLRLPDGSEIKTVEVHRFCHGSGKQCIILTCNSQDLGIRGDITIGKAYGMWKAARALVDKKRVTSLGELSRTMQKARRRSWHHERLAIIGVVTASGVVYWIHERQGSSKDNAGVAKRCASTRRAERAALYIPSPRVSPPSLPPLPPLLRDGNLRPPQVSLPPPVLPPSLPLLTPPPPPLPSPRL